MRGAIAWSVDWLSPAERRVFRRLSVFAGGWMLDAAESGASDICGQQAAPLDLLSALVRKTLVGPEPMASENLMRYRLVEPVRQYAQEELRVCGEHDAMHTRHANFFLSLAE